MASKPSTNIPVLDLEEQLHTGANPSHNSSKPHHLQEIMTELLGSSQTHPTRCKHPGAPAARTSLCLFPRQGLQAQVTREGPKVSGCVGCLRHQVCISPGSPGELVPGCGAGGSLLAIPMMLSVPLIGGV